MPQQPYDKSSKWLLEHCGKALAFVGGLTDVVSTRSLQSEVVQSRQLPDGLLEVRRQGQSEPTLLLVEFCTYPESRVAEQLMDDVLLVYQARKLLPEVLALVLCPRGQMKIQASSQVQSALGWTRLEAAWKVVELWNLDAEAMLTAADVGVVPMIPLMHFDGPPEPLFRRCRARIDQEGGGNRESLLAVSRVLSSLKFNESGLLNLFMRRKTMIESPEIKEIVEEAQAVRARKDIERAIQVRLGKLSDDSRARLQGVTQEKILDELHTFAVICPTLEAFVERLNQETTPAPKPTSTRRKRKS